MQIDRPIAIALILFIILLVAFVLVMPEYKTFVKLQTELGTKKAEFNAEFDYYAAISKSYFDLQGRKDDVKKIDDALPENPDLGKIVYFLQEAGKESGLMVKDLFLSKSSTSASGTKKNTIVKDLTFSMDLVGDYPSLGNFMASLEKSSRIFEITNISFSPGPQPPYTFSLQIKTHSY